MTLFLGKEASLPRPCCIGSAILSTRPTLDRERRRCLRGAGLHPASRQSVVISESVGSAVWMEPGRPVKNSSGFCNVIKKRNGLQRVSMLASRGKTLATLCHVQSIRGKIAAFPRQLENRLRGSLSKCQLFDSWFRGNTGAEWHGGGFAGFGSHSPLCHCRGCHCLHVLCVADFSTWCTPGMFSILPQQRKLIGCHVELATDVAVPVLMESQPRPLSSCWTLIGARHMTLPGALRGYLLFPSSHAHCCPCFTSRSA